MRTVVQMRRNIGPWSSIYWIKLASKCYIAVLRGTQLCIHLVAIIRRKDCDTTAKIWQARPSELENTTCGASKACCASVAEAPSNGK
jgi:hypothetical protein